MANGQGTGDGGSGKGGGDLFSTPPTNYTDSLDNATESTTELSESQRQLVDDANDLQKQVEANTDSLKDYGRGATEAKRKLETLGEAWDKQAQSIKRSAHELVTLNAKLHEAGGAITGFMGQMKQAISLGSVYNRLLKEVETSQKGYISSLNFSTASFGNATAAHTKYLKAINAANASAHKTSNQYSIDIKKVQKAQQEVTDRFSGQITAYKNQERQITSLREQTVLLSMHMGVDTAQAADYMRERLEQSGKTLDQVQKETKEVSVAADEYTKKLAALGDEALKTANISRKELLEAVTDASKAFNQGVFDAATYAKALGPLIIEMKRVGATKKELMGLTQGWKKFSDSMMDSKLNSLFGLQAAQDMARNLDMITDPKVRMRVEHQLKEMGGDINDPQTIRAISEAVRGSSDQMAGILMRIAKTDEKVAKEMIYKETGSMMQANAIWKMAQSDSEFMELYKKGSARTADEETKLNEQMEKLKGAIKKGADTKSPMHKTAIETRKIQQKIMNLMKYYYPLMLAAMGAQAVGSLMQSGLGRGLGQRLGRGRIGRWGSRTFGRGRGQAARMAARRTGTGVATRAAASRLPMALAAGGTGAGFLARSAGAGAPTITTHKMITNSAGQRVLARTGGTQIAGRGLAKYGATRALASGASRGLAVLGPAAGVAMAGYEGYQAGKFLDKYAGGKMAKSDPKWVKNALGKDNRLSARMGIGLAHLAGNDMEFLKNVTRVRGDQSQSMIRLTKAYDDAEYALRQHTIGAKKLSKEELEAKKKLVAQNEKAVKLHKKFNRAADKRLSKKWNRKMATKAAGIQSGVEKGGGAKGAKGAIDDWLAEHRSWKSSSGEFQMENLLGGKDVEGASSMESAVALASLKGAAAKAGMDWEDFKKLIRERQTMASMKWSAGAKPSERRAFLEKKAGVSTTGMSEEKILQLWNQKTTRGDATRAMVSIPEHMRKKISDRQTPSLKMSAAFESNPVDDSPIVAEFNPVDESFTLTKTTAQSVKLDGASIGKGMKQVMGAREPNTTNAPGKQ